MSRKILRSPPKIKVLEAAGSIGDKRVHITPLLTGGWRAIVTSSDGTRRYNVIVVPSGDHILAYSNDNGTKLRGYVGYPIIAVLMIAGVLPRDTIIEDALRGIRWKALNEKYRKYSLVIDHVLGIVSRRGVSPERVVDYMDTVMKKLRSLTIVYDSSLSQ